MKKKALLISSQNPYPCVNNGIERLMVGYESFIFSDFDVYILYYRETHPIQVLHYGQPLPAEARLDLLLAEDFAFVLLFDYDTDFQQDDFIRPFLARFPCFQFLQAHPVAGINDNHFRGIIAQSSATPDQNIFVPGSFYDSGVFFKKNGRRDELIVCVARIHEHKNQLELVQGYKERIYNKYGWPLYLAGGGGLRYEEDLYFKEVMKFVDGVAILSNANPEKPLAPSSWLEPAEVASLFHCARLAVMPSPQESFCIALMEALACGTTCVVNGRYSAFKPEDVAPRVFGSVTEKRGTILDWVEAALQNDIRIDSSAWAAEFALAEIKPKMLRFIQERLTC
jgi:glycosyltransferase involved in cell wall biosynthesis